MTIYTPSKNILFSEGLALKSQHLEDKIPIQVEKKILLLNLRYDYFLELY